MAVVAAIIVVCLGGRGGGYGGFLCVFLCRIVRGCDMVAEISNLPRRNNL